MVVQPGQDWDGDNDAGPLDRHRFAIVQLVNCRAITISLSIMSSVVIDVDPNEAAKLVFKAGQQPAAWLRSAEHLRDAAEIILKHELPAEISYSQAARSPRRRPPL